jgi:hypothetical protein
MDTIEMANLRARLQLLNARSSPTRWIVDKELLGLPRTCQSLKAARARGARIVPAIRDVDDEDTPGPRMGPVRWEAIEQFYRRDLDLRHSADLPSRLGWA